MKILFTGASSFTGCWMAQSLAQAGHEVVATFTQPTLENYDRLRARRVQQVLPFVRPVFAVSTGGSRFLEVLRSERWDAWCQHGAEARDYKSPAFSWRNALLENTRQLEANLTAFVQDGGRTLILTGTYFEADEGAGTEPRVAFSPYGLSKTLTSQAYRFAAENAGLTLAKYVFPNPVGPLEEPKLVASLVADWQRGETPVLHTPDYIRDNLPVPLLARDYADFVAKAVNLPDRSFIRRNPSGWVGSVGAFAQRVAEEFGRRSGKTFAVCCHNQTQWREPRDRHNLDDCLPKFSPEDETAFWSAWHASYFQPVATDVSKSAVSPAVDTLIR